MCVHYEAPGLTSPRRTVAQLDFIETTIQDTFLRAWANEVCIWGFDLQPSAQLGTSEE